MMLDDRDRGKLQDILQWGEDTLTWAGDLDAHALTDDRKTYVAVLHGIQIIGEAAWTLSDGIKSCHTEIP